MYIPDNYDKWKEHEAALEAKIENRPKCDICGERIQDDYCFELGGELICEDCLNKHFRKWTEDYE